MRRVYGGGVEPALVRPERLARLADVPLADHVRRVAARLRVERHDTVVVVSHTASRPARRVRRSASSASGRSGRCAMYVCLYTMVEEQTPPLHSTKEHRRDGRRRSHNI